jgi:hypothetical protein
VPVITWLVAFLVWFYWNDLTGTDGRRTDRTRPVSKTTPNDSTLTKPPKEKILDEDRKKLEDILRQRG